MQKSQPEQSTNPIGGYNKYAYCFYFEAMIDGRGAHYNSRFSMCYHSGGRDSVAFANSWLVCNNFHQCLFYKVNFTNCILINCRLDFNKFCDCTLDNVGFINTYIDGKPVTKKMLKELGFKNLERVHVQSIPLSQITIPEVKAILAEKRQSLVANELADYKEQQAILPKWLLKEKGITPRPNHRF